ncbi:unnamed protein product [Prorocentrum cordatum]|uniref:Uncharacterized protein n=1 Tax=Prorocentrum cordatum TaxID=2364126 RepID=A0ABN9PDC6_9DINO|nr:unnamed protein product [Polarella glacialis]
MLSRGYRGVRVELLEAGPPGADDGVVLVGRRAMGGRRSTRGDAFRSSRRRCSRGASSRRAACGARLLSARRDVGLMMILILGGGILNRWNEHSPATPVALGDGIVEVNGITPPCRGAMLARLRGCSSSGIQPTCVEPAEMIAHVYRGTLFGDDPL